jgi:hypothetical protein
MSCFGDSQVVKEKENGVCGFKEGDLVRYKSTGYLIFRIDKIYEDSNVVRIMAQMAGGGDAYSVLVVKDEVRLTTQKDLDLLKFKPLFTET